MEFTIEERVARGAKRLDLHLPKWEREIDPEEFDITSTESCIIAQLFTNWSEGSRSLGLDCQRSQAEHGFELTHEEYCSDDYRYIAERLEEAWNTEITKRLGA